MTPTHEQMMDQNAYDILSREEFEDCVSSTSNYKRNLVLAHDAALRQALADAQTTCRKISNAL